MRPQQIDGRVRSISRIVDDERPAHDMLMNLRAVDAAPSTVIRILPRERITSQLTAAMSLSDPAEQRRVLSKVIGDILLPGGT